MPRGEHPNSKANLKPLNKRTKKEQRKIQVSGGIASGEARAVYKSLTEDLKERMTAERVAKANDRIISMMEHGNLHAYEIVRDMLGENPNNMSTEMIEPVKVIFDV